MSGIVGSRLNIRGSGVVGKLGTDGQVLTSSGAGASAVFEAAGGGAVSAINNATESELVTIGSTTTELDSETNLIYNGTILGAGATGASADLGTGIHIRTSDSGASVDATADDLVVESSAHTGMTILSGATSTGRIAFGKSANNLMHQILASHAGAGGELTFYAAGSATPYMMFQNNANKVSFGQSGFSETTGGGQIGPSQNYHVVDSGNCLVLNRETDDGYILQFRQGNTMEGNVTSSGSTIQYNTFCGSHWGRLADNSQPTILRGTVIETIDTMINWYRVKYTVDEGLEKEKIGHDEIALPDGKSVGDIIKHTAESGIEYDAEIELQDNEQLPMTKISDTEDSKAVYGVFSAWDNEPDDGVNDMMVASLGAFIIRVHKDETVAIGDLLSSKGDGTAKVQADDIMRSKTIAKVTSTNKSHIYADDSYCVPCTIHCG